MAKNLNEGVWSSLKALANRLPNDKRCECNNFAEHILDQNIHKEITLRENISLLETYTGGKLVHDKELYDELINRAMALYTQVLKIGDVYNYNEYDKDLAWFSANMFMFVCYYNKDLKTTDINNVYATILNKLASLELGDENSGKTKLAGRSLSIGGIFFGILSNYRWGPLIGNFVGILVSIIMFWYLKFKRKHDVTKIINTGDLYTVKPEIPIPDINKEFPPN